MAENGTRPGTRPFDKISGWDYVSGRHPSFQAIRANDREQRRWEEAMTAAAEAFDLAAARCRVALVMSHGGHVERSLMSKLGISADDDAEAVVARCLSGLPMDIQDRALPKKK